MATAIMPNHAEPPTSTVMSGSSSRDLAMSPDIAIPMVTVQRRTSYQPRRLESMNSSHADGGAGASAAATPHPPLGSPSSNSGNGFQMLMRHFRKSSSNSKGAVTDTARRSTASTYSSVLKGDAQFVSSTIDDDIEGSTTARITEILNSRTTMWHGMRLYSSEFEDLFSKHDIPVKRRTRIISSVLMFVVCLIIAVLNVLSNNQLEKHGLFSWVQLPTLCAACIALVVVSIVPVYNNRYTLHRIVWNIICGFALYWIAFIGALWPIFYCEPEYSADLQTCHDMYTAAVPWFAVGLTMIMPHIALSNFQPHWFATGVVTLALDFTFFGAMFGKLGGVPDMSLYPILLFNSAASIVSSRHMYIHERRAFANALAAKIHARQAMHEREERIAASASRYAQEQVLSNTSHELRNPLHAALVSLEYILTTDEHPVSDWVVSELRSTLRSLRYMAGVLTSVLSRNSMSQEPDLLESAVAEFNVHIIVRDAVNQSHVVSSLRFSTTLSGDVPHNLHGDSVRLRQLLSAVLQYASCLWIAGTASISVKLVDKLNDEISSSATALETHNPNLVPRFLQFTVSVTGENRRGTATAATEDADAIAVLGYVHELLRWLRGASDFARVNETRRLMVYVPVLEELASATSLRNEPATILPHAVPESAGVAPTPAHEDDSFDSKSEVLLRRGNSESNPVFGGIEPMSPNDAITTPTFAPTLRVNRLVPTVLFVDDESINRRLGERMLKTLGCNVVLATDGDEVLDCLTAHKIDLILMDIVMLRVNGDIACREIRKKGFSVPVVAATGNWSPNNITEALVDYGFDAYLPKPYSQTGVAGILQQLLGFSAKLPLARSPAAASKHVQSSPCIVVPRQGAAAAPGLAVSSPHAMSASFSGSPSAVGLPPTHPPLPQLHQPRISGIATPLMTPASAATPSPGPSVSVSASSTVITFAQQQSMLTDSTNSVPPSVPEALEASVN